MTFGQGIPTPIPSGFDPHGRALYPCKNPLCNRRVPGGILYCCPACTLAHEGKYEIHESGSLAHSEGCNERHAERSKLA